ITAERRRRRSEFLFAPVFQNRKSGFTRELSGPIYVPIAGTIATVCDMRDIGNPPVKTATPGEPVRFGIQCFVDETLRQRRIRCIQPPHRIDPMRSRFFAIGGEARELAEAIEEFLAVEVLPTITDQR